MQLWDCATESPVDVALPPGPVGLAGFRPDGTLVVDQPNWMVVFWDVATGRPIRTVQLEEPPGDDRAGDAHLRRGSARRRGAPRPCLRLGHHHGLAGRRPRGPAGHGARRWRRARRHAATIAIGSAGGGISFYDLATERVIGEPVYGHGAGIRDLAYSASGEYLVSVADDGLIGLWGSNDAPGLISRPVAKDALSPSPSDDGSRVLILPPPGTPRGPVG